MDQDELGYIQSLLATLPRHLSWVLLPMGKAPTSRMWRKYVWWRIHRRCVECLEGDLMRSERGTTERDGERGEHKPEQTRLGHG
jgi:hypothetical protein